MKKKKPATQLPDMVEFARIAGIDPPQMITGNVLALYQVHAGLIDGGDRDVADVIGAAIAMAEGKLTPDQRSKLLAAARRTLGKRQSRRATLVRLLKALAERYGDRRVFAAISARTLYENQHAIAPYTISKSEVAVGDNGSAGTLAERIAVEMKSAKDLEGRVKATFRGARVPPNVANDWVNGVFDNRPPSKRRSK